MSSHDEIVRFFDAIARRYDRVYAPDRETSRRRLARVLEELPPRARVLDLGVGTGRELSALLDAGHIPTGLDASEEMLAICARRSRPVPLVVGDFWQPLPFAAESFDAVIALHGTLAHAPDEDAHSRLERELSRVVAPHGVFVAEVPSPEWLARLPVDAAQEGDLRVRRVAPDRVEHEDRVAGAKIEASIVTPEQWRTIFGAWPSIEALPLDTNELLVVARRSPRPVAR